mmetsp:Transcript_9264/g.10242  ORF Transcript_9264/g.10242 Transcript_9264/m.10242 type:complete len:149 (-) Transcript_9264:93-539(-)
MSGEGDAMEVSETQVQENVVEEQEFDVIAALREVLKKAIVHDGIVRGLRQCVKALDRREAHLCILASNIKEKAYTQLVEALCNQNETLLVKVKEDKELGEWAGLARYDKDGKPRRIQKCGIVVIRDYGEPTAELDALLKHFKQGGAAM